MNQDFPVCFFLCVKKFVFSAVKTLPSQKNRQEVVSKI
jgi:hypothetical protein